MRKQVKKVFICFIICLFLVTLVNSEVLAGEMSISVLSATATGEPIENAEVSFKDGDEIILEGTTDNHGRMIIDRDQFRKINNNSVRAIIEKEGYSTLNLRGPFDGLTFVLSEEMTELAGYRIVLTWGEEPRDLDSHLVYEDNHIYYGNMRGEGAHLDNDEIHGYGPETTTITETLYGTEYVYAVHDFTNRAEEFSNRLSYSNAKVSVYIGSTLIETFYAPQGQIGNLWVLFSIDGYNDLEVINEFTTTNSVSETLSFLQDFLDEPEVLEERIASDALELNREGERLYHEDRLDEAIEYFRDAIEIKDDYAQAYSNLGLAYQEADKLAEAIWANRKAISVASGSNANTVKASSFFNIARIFESREQWSQALKNYEWALENREHSAYEEGIARMRERIN